MKIMTVIFIILFCIILIAVVYGVIVTNIAIGLNNTIITLQTNVRTLELIKEEYSEREKIFQRQEEVIEKIKSAKTVRDFVNILRDYGITNELRNTK